MKEDFSNKLIDVCIIDDGVNEKAYDNIDFIKYNIEILPDMSISQRSNYNKYELSHGTTCAAIIKKYCSSAVISSIKIINYTDKSTIKQLVKAIEWCCENNIKVINLSIGSIDYRDYYCIKEIINYVSDKNILIIAACNNKDIITYPASLYNVIGVKRDKSRILCDDEFIYNINADDGIDIIASSQHTLTNYKEKKEKTLVCNSYATPLITAKVCNIVKNNFNINIDEVRENLKVDAINFKEIKEKKCFYKSMEWAKHCVVFNLYKYNYIEYQTPYIFNIYKTKNIKCGNIYDGIMEINKYLSQVHDGLDKFQTILIIIRNEFKELEQGKFNDFMKPIIDYNKNIIYIDDYSKNDIEFFSTNSCKFWFTSMYRYFENNLELNDKISIPIIAVYNIGCNKFYSFLQEISNLFKKDEYNNIVGVDMSLGELYKFNFLPIKKTCSENKRIELSLVNKLEKLYNLDLLILGLDFTCENITYIKKINQLQDIDIKIIICNNIDENILCIIKQNLNSKIIIFSNEYIEEELFNNIRIFNTINKNTIKQAYDYILELYDKD